MELDFRAFAFIITLAAVVNGLGIVRWVAGFAEYLRQANSLQVKHYRSTSDYGCDTPIHCQSKSPRCIGRDELDLARCLRGAVRHAARRGGETDNLSLCS